jgi:DNA modification methylase
MSKTKAREGAVDAPNLDAEINVDSLWVIGPRAKGGKRENNYHGNFVPQIPSDLIRRFTNPGDVVVEPFMGSGTTLFECERLGRKYIGFDINSEIVEQVKAKMDGDYNDYFIHQIDSGSKDAADAIIKDLSKFQHPAVDLLIVHPPYFDIIKFTDKECDLSNTTSLDEFIDRYVEVIQQSFKYIRKNGHLAVVVGDLYRNSEVVPLGFLLMDATLQNFKCKLKGIVIKDMVGNRAKIGLEALWRKRALKSDYYLFKHEYMFVFRKI